MWPVLHYAIHGDNDFMNLYAGGVLAGSPDLYNMDAVRHVQGRFWERPRYLPFTRLPFYAVVLAPLRFLNYRYAYWLWQMLCLAAVAATVWLLPARHRWLTAAACCWSLPLVDGFVMGQDVAIVVLAAAASLALLARGKDFAAGCVLSLCLIKFNLFLALPILILARRMRRFGWGAAVGCAALAAVSFAVAGWNWPVPYVAVLRFPATTALYSGLPNLRGLFAHLPGVDYWQAGATCVTVVVTWIAARRSSLRLAVSATILCGLLVSHHAFCADAFVVVPAAILLWDGAAHQLHRIMALLLLCPLVYLPLATTGHPLLHPAILFLATLGTIAWRAKDEEQPWSGSKPSQAISH